MRIDKRYTIKFAFAGVRQYAQFNEVKGKIINPRLSISWSKAEEIPSVEGLDNIEDILKVIKEVSYGKKAAIHLINNMPVKVYENKEAVAGGVAFGIALENFIEKEAKKYLEAYLLPIMKKNKWFVSSSHIGFPVLAFKNDEGEWDNIGRDDREEELAFEYLCLRFVRHFNKGESNLKSEHSNSVDGFRPFINCIPQEYLIEKELWVENV